MALVKVLFFFSEKLEALKVPPSKKTEQIALVELSVIKKNRKKYGEPYFYINKTLTLSQAKTVVD